MTEASNPATGNLDDVINAANAPAQNAMTGSIAESADHTHNAPIASDSNEPSLKDRAAVLIAAYALGMEHNAPRTMSEMKEMKALLLGD